ncbi:MAG: NAD-dependent epimerase/dehydratase family protein [Bacteroidetes bacterium]|nr:MAG: NAD-dependent epimerase/dehydratase family protein [Bacteroidota bacterium]
MSSKKIMVFGGTGFYGRQVVKSLLDLGQSVKVMSRSSQKARQILGEQVAIFEGDVTNHSDIVNSLKDVKAIVLCLSAVNFKLIRKRQQIERDAVLDIMEEAEKAGIERLVYFSGYEMRPEVLKTLKIPDFGSIMMEIEGEIKRSAFNWTILGAPPSFEVFFAFLRNGKLAVPGGGKNPIPTVSPFDVGKIAAQTVLRTNLAGKRIRMPGPQANSFPEVAKKMSAITGQKVKHIAIPITAIRIVSILAYPFTPFPRFLYKSLKLLNNFPEDLIEKVPDDHQFLLENFDYEPITLERAIQEKLIAEQAEDS